ncbi:MAG: 2-oxo acid dehydrogenase subunit E2 [Bdellovibrionales bacterium]|nr:2-oxo acid dehydrogenase subunit E2 [Bdellovibrionales bacterium]
MATQNVKLPDVGEGVTEGELVKWLVKVGDTVKADQPVVEVMTDKATVEVPSPYAGVVKELKFKEGDVIPIETVILILDADGAKPAGASAAPPQQLKTPSAVESQPGQMAKPATAPVSAAALNKVGTASAAMGAGATAGMDVYPPAADSRVLATPATRRLARETGVDINQLSGTGMAGRVTRDDVVKAKGSNGTGGGAGAVSARAPIMDIPRPAVISQPGALEERVPLRGIRKKIAENMQMAKHVIPHFTLMEEVRVDELVKLRAQAKEAAEKYGVKVTYLPFIMKALIATCREFPMFNASMDDQAQEIVYKKSFNVGFAADTPTGLMVPVVKNADFKTMLQISQEIQQLAGKARDGKLALEDMRGATITVTNIGSVGGVYATPIINHPEVAILGVYKIQDKPIWNGKEFTRGQVMNFTITCDHRLIDGAVAANFMKSFAGRIENPSQLMLDMI